MARRVNTLAKKFISVMDLPSDVLLDLPQISLVGNTELVVENHKGLQKYTPSLIKLRVKSCSLAIFGMGLWIQFIGRDDIRIKGQIDKVEFEQE